MEPGDHAPQPVPLDPAALDGHAPPIDRGGGPSRLSARQQERRDELRALIDPALRRLLADGERVAWIAPAVHVPRLVEALGLGVWYRFFFRVALVFTDRRLIELSLDGGGQRLGTRTLSFPWTGTRRLRHGLLSLALSPQHGRTQKWRLTVRADRRVVAALAARLTQQSIGTAPPENRAVPLWHCPRCAAEVAAQAGDCPSCATVFRSRRLAVALAFAFPGAGLFYTGHPVLGALDLLGELFLAAVIAVLLLSSESSADTLAYVAVGAVLFLLTKLESAHLAHLFAARTVPEESARRRWWQGFALGGALLTALAVAAPLVFAGALVNRIDRDLVFRGEEFGWTGGLDRALWEFGVDEDQRSEWVLEDGQGVFVFAFPLGPFEPFDTLRGELERGTAEPIGSIEEFALGELSGLRLRDRQQDEDGQDLVRIRHFVFDRANRDIHLIVTFADPDVADQAYVDLVDLLETAEWVEATAP
jgi:nitroreductase